MNAIVVVLSLLLFGYTFVAKAHLVEHTREFVTEQTLSYSRPLVEFMRAGLNAPLSHKLVSQALRAEIERELELYDANPAEYVTSLTSERKPDFGAEKVAQFKERVHNHYQSTLEALVRDLSIFSGSNLVAGVFAIWLLLITKFSDSGKVVTFSFVIFAAVAFSTYSYLEGVSFLRIVLQSHLGWWYPAGVTIMIVWLVLEHGLHKKKNAEQGGGGQPATRSESK